MIAGLRGKIFKKKLDRVYIDVHDVIYEVFVSLNSYSALNGDVFVYISEIIREDTYALYGFSDENEKNMFDTLIKINGVGPKVALAICSTFTPTIFATITQEKNVSALKQVSGIGPKSASRILVELGDFSVDEIEVEQSSSMSEVSHALEGLGFKKDKITKVLQQIEFSSTEETIKEALKKLTKF